MDPVLVVLVCLLVGVSAGFLGGLFGIGGGVIVVPALLFLLDTLSLFPASEFPPNTVILVTLGTSMASVVFTTLSSAIAQYRRNAIEWEIVKNWVAYLVLGALLATVIAKMLPAEAIKLFIGIFIACVATLMVTRWKPPPTRNKPSHTVTRVVASGGGVICGLAGIGGGNVVVPTLLFFNTRAIQATAAASTLGVAISVAGTFGYILNGLPVDIPNAIGYVYLPALVPIAIGSVVAAPLGVKVAHTIRATNLRRGFGILMFFVAARMIYTAI